VRFKIEEEKSGKWLWLIRGRFAKSVDITDAWRPSSSIIFKKRERILEFRLEDILEVGIKSNRNWTNAFFYVRIIIERYIQGKIN